MLKKGLLVLALMALVMGGVFAQSPIALSAGAGAYFTSDFGGGLKIASEEMKTPYYGGGGLAFFDATYAELSAGFFYGKGELKFSDEDMGPSYLGLDIGLLGKYPIELNSSLTVFPLLGITYRVVLSVKDKDGNKIDDSGIFKSGDFSALWFKAGGGLDYSFTDSIYLRGALTYGIRLANKFEKDMKDLMGLAGAFGDTDIKADTRLGHGLDFKVAVGYRF